MTQKRMNVSVLLFDNFETLDVFGPVEILGRNKEEYQITFYSLSGVQIKNEHGILMQTEPLKNIEEGTDIFLIPGGLGTRSEVNNVQLIDAIKQISNQSKYVLTVCTGSALLAKTGLLEDRKATSNKRAFQWVTSQEKNVNWIQKARWVVDGKYYTSSGVSAGMDMTLGFLADMHGIEFARTVAFQIEYNWQENKDEDNFSSSL
jgi:putative intracellular protease/amidase